jgi:Tfp pilus assembly protein PilF
MLSVLRRFTLLAGLLAVSHLGAAQAAPDEQAQQLIREGVTLFDAGSYDAAIAKYQQALALRPNDIIAKAELALTFYQIGKYEQAVALCREAVATPGQKGPNLYATYANSLDALERPAEAEAVYQEGLKAFPGSFMLLYNLGVTQHGQQKYAEAQQTFQLAVQANPHHPGSNLSWGLGMMEAGNRIPALLALANYLLLEPNTKRSAENLARLHQLMRAGVEKTAEGGTVINISKEQLDATQKKGKKNKGAAAPDNFAGNELMLSILSSTGGLPPELAQNEVEQFAFQFSLLSQSLKPAKGQAGFGWTHYVPFFQELEKKGHTKTFAYLIHLPDDEKPYVRQWLQQHPDELKALYAFVEGYRWPK